MLYKLLRRNPESRDDIIMVTSGLGIVVNLLIAIAKILIGVLSSSIAIVTEGMNNMADFMTSMIALLGAKLAKKHPDEKHPFGYGRIEYLASLIIATLILVTGVQMLISSVKLIFEPEEMSISYLAIGIIAVTSIIKYFLGVYTMKMGKKAESGSLIGVGTECRNDSFASVITIISSLIFILFRFSVDAYAGIIISALIIKAGIDVLRETLADLLGRPGDEALAKMLYKKIRQTDGIVAAVDMMLHNYGPDAWSGSVNVEIDHKKTVGEIYQFLHALQLEIMHEYHVTMVFGVYAVDNDHEEIKNIRKHISAFSKDTPHITNFHAVYLDREADTIYCDFIVDYKLRDWDTLRAQFTEYMAKQYSQYKLALTIETDFV